MTLRVRLLTLTETAASEHVYAAALGDALAARGVELVGDWRDADVVHLFEVNPLTRAALSAFRFPTVLRALRSETPLVVSTDDLYFVGRPDLTARPRLYGPNRRLQRWLFDRADAVVAISESVRRNLEPHLAAPPTVVRHGVGGRYFADPAADDGYVLHVSFPSRRKNPEAVLEVARRLDAPFVLAGGGWEAYSDDLGPGVDVRGYVPEAELADLYARAAVFYFPTRHEGFGLPVLEAMAAGTAVVASDAYAVPEVAGDAAALHGPDAVEAHLASIRRLLRDDGARRALGAAARERAREFTWADAAERTAALYRSL